MGCKRWPFQELLRLRQEQNHTRPQRKGRSTKKTLARNIQIQPENNIEFEGKEQMVNQHIRQRLKEFQEVETIEFNRLDWNNLS